MDMISELWNMDFVKMVKQGVQFGLVVASALFIWNSCIVFSGCDSPIVVVLSGSMEPNFFRGDLLFLTHHSFLLPKEDYYPGDIVVFDIQKPIPIVHRILRYYEKTTTDFKVLTRGDNNQIHDRGLYPNGKLFINPSDIGGRIRGTFPYVGVITIWMNDYPMLKWSLISVLLLLVMTSKEDQ